MSTLEKPAAADPYLAAVAAALAGVPDLERQELLDDLADHLAELAADEDGDLAERLGAPDAYAAEFVASAGIEVPAAAPPAPPSLTGRATAVADQLRESRATRAVAAFLPDLRPGWWVLRAWAGLAVLAVVAADDRSVFPVPDPFGNPLVDVVALAAAIVGSVHLGRLGRGWSRVLTAVGIVGVAVAVTQGSPRTQYVDNTDGETYGVLTGPDGRYIQNIWPYDGEGNPIEGVFLFDQDGNPVSVGDQPAGGVVVPGLFPQPQVTYEYDPATGAERQVPATAPVVQVPRLPASTTSTTSTTAPPEPTAPPETTAPPDTTLPPDPAAPPG